MKILIASPIDLGAIAELRERHQVTCAFDASEDLLQELISDCEALVFRSGVAITTAVMEAAPALHLLIRAGIGIDNLHVEYARQRGLRLLRIPEPGAEAVVEMSFALMLALSRNLLGQVRVGWIPLEEKDSWSCGCGQHRYTRRGGRSSLGHGGDRLR